MKRFLNFFVQAFTEENYGFDYSGKPCPIMCSNDKPLLQQFVKRIAQNPVGRIVLVRLLVEIRRPIDNGFLGIDKKVFDTGTCRSLAKYRTRNLKSLKDEKSIIDLFQKIEFPNERYAYAVRFKNRSIIINFVKDAEKGSSFVDEKGTINVRTREEDYEEEKRRKYSCVPMQDEVFYEMIQRDHISSFYHEIGHWFRLLIHPERVFREKYICLDNVVDVNFNQIENEATVEFYWRFLIAFYFRDLKNRKNLLEIWLSPVEQCTLFPKTEILFRILSKNVDIEEIRNIFGIPSCKNMQLYLNKNLSMGISKFFIDNYKKLYIEGDSDVFENYFRKYEYDAKELTLQSKEEPIKEEPKYMRIGHGNIDINQKNICEAYKSVVKLARFSLSGKSE